MANENGGRLSDIEPNALKPINQQELKSVSSDLKDWAKTEPDIARLLEQGGGSRPLMII